MPCVKLSYQEYWILHIQCLKWFVEEYIFKIIGKKDEIYQNNVSGIFFIKWKLGCQQNAYNTDINNISHDCLFLMISQSIVLSFF